MIACMRRRTVPPAYRAMASPFLNSRSNKSMSASFPACEKLTTINDLTRDQSSSAMARSIECNRSAPIAATAGGAAVSSTPAVMKRRLLAPKSDQSDCLPTTPQAGGQCSGPKADRGL